MNKKLISLIAGAAIVAAATGCSQTATSSVAGTSASEASSTATEELSGTLSMNGSTSMEKVIKAVNGAFMEKNKGVTAENCKALKIKCKVARQKCKVGV